MGDAVAVELAREEMRRAGTNPRAPAGLALLLMGVAVFAALVALSWILVPGPVPTRPEVAFGTLAGAATAFGLCWVLGRLWAGARLRQRAHHIGLSPNLEPGLWAPDSRTDAGMVLAILLLMGFFLFLGSLPRESAAQELAGTAVTWTAFVCIPIAVLALGQSFVRQRRRGGSRFVPRRNATQWCPGEEITGVLEVGAWLGSAHAVRFELVETTSEVSDAWLLPFKARVRSRTVASVTVEPRAFENPPGLVVVPMALAIPDDARPEHSTSTGGRFPWEGFHSAEVSWSLCATAAGADYRADFTIALVSPDRRA